MCPRRSAFPCAGWLEGASACSGGPPMEPTCSRPLHRVSSGSGTRSSGAATGGRRSRDGVRRRAGVLTERSCCARSRTALRFMRSLSPSL
uniref:Putative secreted protein n=1 Tax=Ixodes ricinus TaxID=34613 RepID=A0A6B0UGJ1_IXORI